MKDPLDDGRARGAIAYLRPPPVPEIFRRRALRLAALAADHAAGDFLAYLSGLAAAQWKICDSENGALGANPPGAEWRKALAAVLAEVESGPGPDAARATVARLRRTPADALDALAARVCAGDLEDEDAATAPFVGAALQIVHTRFASRLAAAPIVPTAGGRCPVCASPPVAGVVQGDDPLRYLACSLCGSQWHRTRVQCAACGEGDGLAYLTIEQYPTVKAEACSRCQTYLKLFYLEKDPQAEPFADDIATLALDVLVASEGYARAGVNCFWSP